MLYRNIDFFGINYLEDMENLRGKRLWRVTKEILDIAHPNTKRVMKWMSSNELRFVLEGDFCTITLDVYSEEYREHELAYIYLGEFQHQIVRLETGTNIIRIELPQTIRDYIETDYFRKHQGTFAPWVVRIMLPHGDINFVDVCGDIRPPALDEVPKYKMLSYGTSITQGLFSTSPAIYYPKLLARRLGMDLINYAFCGCCMLEPETMDSIIDSDCDIYLLEISVNMLNKSRTAEEFQEKARYLISGLLNNNKKVVAISPLLHYTDIGVYKWDLVATVCTGDDYRKALEEVIEENRCDNLLYLNGRELVRNFSDLSADLIHPGDYGMIDFAVQIEQRINEKWVQSRE